MITCELCKPASLCSLHLDGAYGCLAGVAALRGELWAESVARRYRCDRPWPHGARPRAIALSKIADLTNDPRLTERLADQVERWAARWWSRNELTS